MKLSKVILENNKIVEKKELHLTEEDINTIASLIAEKLDDYLDVGNDTILKQAVSEAISEVTTK